MILAHQLSVVSPRLTAPHQPAELKKIIITRPEPSLMQQLATILRFREFSSRGSDSLQASTSLGSDAVFYESGFLRK